MNIKAALEKINRNEDLLIVFVGDSITYGLDHCLPEETFVAKIAAFFARKYPEHRVQRYDLIPSAKEYSRPVLVNSGSGKSDITVVKSGIGGNTVARITERIEGFTGKFVNGREPDIICIMAGINDALKEDASKYVTDSVFKENYKKLLNDIKKRNPQCALVLMTPSYNDWGRIAESHLEPYCDRVKELAGEFCLPIIDVHKLWMEHLIPGSEHFGQRDWLSDSEKDACHPTPLGAEVMASFIFSQLLNLNS